MSDEMRGFYSAMGGLLRSLAGIIMALFAILVFALILPAALRVLREPDSLGESVRQAAQALAGGLGGLVSAIFGLLTLIIVVWVFAALLPEVLKVRPWRHIKLGEEALDTLRLRYAKGEITKEQYLEMKKTLEA